MFDLESTQTVERRRRAAQAEHAALMRATRHGRPRLRSHAAVVLRAVAERLDPGAREQLKEVRA